MNACSVIYISSKIIYNFSILYNQYFLDDTFHRDHRILTRNVLIITRFAIRELICHSFSFHRRNETKRNGESSETRKGEDKREGKKRDDIAYCTVSPPHNRVSRPTRVNRAPDFTIPYTNEFILLLRTSCFRLTAIVHQPLYYRAPVFF